jgi:hypothetical protein
MHDTVIHVCIYICIHLNRVNIIDGMGSGTRGRGRAGGGTAGGVGGGRDLVMFVDEKGRAQQTRPELREVISLPSGGTADGGEVCLMLSLNRCRGESRSCSR